MENKPPYIDDFLSTKLGNLSALPHNDTWAILHKSIMHLKHPIDASLNTIFKDLEAAPNTQFSKNFISELPQNIHAIDFSLFQKLEKIEALPYPQTWQNIQNEITSKRKKRYFIWLWFLPLIALLCFCLPFFNSNKIEKQQLVKNENNIQNKLSKVEELKAGNNQFITENRKYILEKNVQYTPKLKTTNNKTYSTITNYSNSNDDGANFDNYTMYPININYILLPYPKFNLDTLEYIKTNKMAKNNYPQKKLSPFSFSIMGGYTNAQTISSKIKTDNVHKDALSLFESTTGKNNNGQQYSLMAGYRFKRYIDFKIGLNYMQINASNIVQYIYNQVPLYNAKGEIFAYGTRPNNISPQVNQKAVNKAIAINIPIQVFTMISELNKLSIWGGVGAEFNIDSRNKVELFSFENGRMETLSSQQYQWNKTIPSAQLLLNYQYKPQWHLLFQLQTTYQTNNYFIDNIHYRKNSIIPSFKIGIQFNPLKK